MIHAINEFYNSIYLLGPKVPKRDRFGIHLRIENISLDLLELSITAALESRENKRSILNSLRIKVEVLKRLLRNEYEIGIMGKKFYIQLETNLQEISKMTNGWIKYLS